jgi:hypothetical protein
LATIKKFLNLKTMKRLEIKRMEGVEAGGGASYGAGAICGLAILGTVASFVATGPALGIAMGSVTGSLCGFSLWHADKYDNK